MFRQGAAFILLCVGLCPSSFADLQSELVVGGFTKPLFAVAPPGDTNRIFVLEQHTGRIRIVDLKTRTIKSTPFLTVTGIATGNEQGLLGLAFHPGYATNGYFYIDVVMRGGTAGQTQIARYQASGDPAASEVADPGSKKLLLTINQPESNHNGGWLAFGPDGYLYISTGDGGGGNDVHGTPGNGQSRSTLLAKILRIDVDHGDPYAIPDGNPYKGSLSMENAIWAFGLRNPWRCSFDSATGDLWIGDVGQDTREEVDVIPAGVGGLNFGWRPREGFIQNPYGPYLKETPITPAVDPVFDYPHTLGVSVTGGYIYRGSAIPALRGKYIFGDYGSTRFWELTPTGTNGTVREITEEINPGRTRIRTLSSFGEDAAGELYICDHQGGKLFKITGTEPPLIRLEAQQNGNELEIGFQANSGESYTLEASAVLPPSGVWNAVTNLPAGNTRVVTLMFPLAETQQYFRLRTN